MEDFSSKLLDLFGLSNVVERNGTESGLGMGAALVKMERRGRRPAVRPDPVRIERARESLQLAGTTVAVWAEANEESKDVVHKVLQGRLACTKGASHRIAVKLNIKDREPALA